MNYRYILFAVAMLISGLVRPKMQPEPVLFIGEPCSCMESIYADQVQGGEGLIKLLSEREYRWIVVFDSMENRQSLARHLVRTQPQAQIILMKNWSLAPKYRMECASDCAAVLEKLQKDRDEGWKSGF